VRTGGDGQAEDHTAAEAVIHAAEPVAPDEDAACDWATLGRQVRVEALRRTLLALRLRSMDMPSPTDDADTPGRDAEHSRPRSHVATSGTDARQTPGGGV